MKIRIKVCGITAVEEAESAVGCGVDALGLVFYSGSKRCVTVEMARRIADAVPPFVSLVGLFVDATDEQLERVLSQVPLDMLQFHGSESDSDCSRWGRRYLKAIRVRPDTDLQTETAHFPAATGILLDAWRADTPGGTGETFDWRLIPKKIALPIVLAGGLNADNVASAIRQVTPFAVDVSSGVEGVSGKDPQKIREFVEAVRNEC